MDRTEKAEMVKVLEGIFDSSGSVVMAEYSGMDGCGNDGIACQAQRAWRNNPRC